MKAIAFITAAAIAAMAAGCASTSQSDLAALQGKWIGTEVTPAKETEGKCTLQIDGNHLEFRGVNPEEWYKGTFRLAPNTDPRQLIADIEDCPFPDYVGKRSHAIYRIEGHTLTMAGHEPGDAAIPKRFDSPRARVIVVTKQQVE